MDPNGWPLAFLLTLLVEVPVYSLALRRPLGIWGAQLAAVAVNLATHPLAWTTIMSARRAPWAVFAGVEIAVTACEALLLIAVTRTRLSKRRLGWGEAVAMSLAANGFSAGLGLFL